LEENGRVPSSNPERRENPHEISVPGRGGGGKTDQAIAPNSTIMNRRGEALHLHLGRRGKKRQSVHVVQERGKRIEMPKIHIPLIREREEENIRECDHGRKNRSTP